MCKNFSFFEASHTLYRIYTHKIERTSNSRPTESKAFNFSELIVETSAIFTFFKCKGTTFFSFLQVFSQLFFVVN